MSLDAYRAHQRTMRAFLDSQRRVFAKVLTSEKEGDSAVALLVTGARPAEPVSSQVKEAWPADRFSVCRKPLSTTRDTSRLSGCFLIAAKSSDIATPIAHSLKEHGAQPAWLPPASLRSPEALKTSVADIRSQFGPITGLVLAHEVGDCEMPLDLGGWREANLLGVKALFSLLQICAQDLRSAKGSVLACSAMGGDFGRGQAAWQSLPSSGAAVGLMKTAALEWPEVTFKAVDLGSTEPNVVAQVIIDELLSAERALEIGYLDGIRHVFEGARAPLAIETNGQPRWQIEPDWVVLAIGGARGITAEVLGEILVPGMMIHLIGRAREPIAEPTWSRDASTAAELRKKIINLAKAKGTTLTPVLVEKEIAAILRDRQIRGNIEGFRKRGARVVYHSADVRDEAELQAIINAIYDEHGRIDAVIHGAGIIEDKLLVDKTAESFHRVFDTKADSTWLLSRYLKPDSLKCLAFFGSVAGRTGNPGQCDYAAANELVNRFGWWLHRRWPQVKISVINWGPWESGMASAEVNRRFRERGVTPIPPAEGRAFFKREILFGPPSDVEIVAGYFQLPEKKNLPVMVWPLLVGAPVNRSGREALWECSLSLKDYPFLDDHRIDDKIVLPWAVALEFMAEAVQAAWPQWHLTEALNYQQMQGIFLEDDHARRALRITARLQESAEFVQVEAMISDPNRPTRPFYRTAFLLRREPLDPPPPPPLSDTKSARIPTQTFYAEHGFHGPSFRLLDLVTGLDESGVDAAISPRGRGWNWLEVPWIFQPGVLDTAMQIGSFWTQPALDSFALPTRAQRIVRYGTYVMSGEQSRVLVRVRSATKHTIHFDVFVLNSQRLVLLCASGVEMAHSKALLRLASQGPPV